ncbi:hypothetical protein HPB51_011686 [Rhipicephalus microplus]|uniref:PNT domain-containing protein n=1 Tax=Rhipicephalus microplus TaxID=6941 RepID=A0A9J6DMN0_RHIMP|nr:hypothetical protein HPB51_011686 [Rhipicephalus microplus]
MYDVQVHKPCAVPESYQTMSPSSWFGPAAGSPEQQPSSTYRGLYALTVRWQPPAPRGEAPRHRKDSSSLPKDPRQWSREDVAVWLVHVMDQHRLPAVSTDRFLMNGKALCLMDHGDVRAAGTPRWQTALQGLPAQAQQRALQLNQEHLENQRLMLRKRLSSGGPKARRNTKTVLLAAPTSDYLPWLKRVPTRDKHKIALATMSSCEYEITRWVVLADGSVTNIRARSQLYKTRPLIHVHDLLQFQRGSRPNFKAYHFQGCVHTEGFPGPLPSQATAVDNFVDLI